MILVPPCSRLCPILWIQVLSREWSCSWSSTDGRCSNFIWVISNFIAYPGASYITGLMVVCSAFSKTEWILIATLFASSFGDFDRAAYYDWNTIIKKSNSVSKVLCFYDRERLSDSSINHGSSLLGTCRTQPRPPSLRDLVFVGSP